MSSKGQRGNCIYNRQWELNSKYKGWLTAFKADRKKALCKCCDRMIDISNMGESALKSHMKSEGHKNNSRIEGEKAVTLSSFGFVSCRSGNSVEAVKAGTSQSQQQAVNMTIPPPPEDDVTPRSQPSLEGHVSKDNVLKAETLWTLKLITSHYSFNSSKDISQLFSAMFPDSQIIRQFACGERKAAYCCVFGLAEHFKKLLQNSVSGPFVVLFDESLNTKMQEKQMDVHVRFWNDQTNQVATRYFNSEFLGHGTADNLMDHFTKSVLESGLQAKNIIQVSMDGPSVNWKFYGELKKKVNTDYSTTLINIGSCGLHVVHNSFKRGVFAAAHDLKTEWVVVKGIKDYADGSRSSSDEWGTFASVMAASVVANILSYAIIFEDWPHYNPDANGSQTPAVSAYTRALKTSVKSQTEFQPKLMASATFSNVRTDDIFTNVLIQHGRKALNKEYMGSTRSDQLRYFGQVSGTQVKHCEEIFIGAANEERSPKRILLTGKAGIGKTLFSQKLVRDWADDKLFQSQSHFKFVYLLTFRQLNLLENDHFSLQELFNCSTVLDDSSNIDDSLFEYIVNHPEEVLIIIDGYDEYSHQDYITGESEKRYQNTAKEKMPVAALCTKLIKGKLLRDSVVMITSRPDESDKMGGIPFDRYVEIAGFSPEQVQEFIEKYFRESDTIKNVVLDHVMKNEDLVSFAHIPMLCFLMCSCLEYAVETSKSSDDLPVSATDIYSEAVNIFELKHNAASEYRTKEIPEKFNASHPFESTLDTLSELAAELLLQKKPVFEEREMKGKFRGEEIENLKESGLLHCGPPFRKSLLETTKYLSFTHLTIQEYLAARWFVRSNVIPKDISEMVLQFMAGILSKKKNDELMENLLESISSSHRSDRLLLRAKCLSEYQDKEFATNVIKNHPHHNSPKGSWTFSNLNDVDCTAISFLLDVFSALNEQKATTAQHQSSEQSFTVNILRIVNSTLTMSGIKRICESLEKERCSITELIFTAVPLTDECVDYVSGLVCSKLTQLCIRSNSITDTGVTSLCDALTHPHCKVTVLDLSSNQITVTGVTSLCGALTHPSCKVTTLYLKHNQITDTGVTSLCDALRHPNWKVTSLYLGVNQITDSGVTSLSDALTHPSCKVTTLNLSDNKISDTGVTSLCDALTHPSCKVTTLGLSGNQITDTGVTSLCEVVQHGNCKLVTLNLGWNRDISEESKQSLRSLVEQHRPGLKLSL